MICSTCDAPVAVDSLKIWNSRTVCTDCFGVLSGQAAPSQPNPENPRTIRETTVCPACQAEFHKDHPTCPECNTVLDPAFRVARQTKRAVKEVSGLVVENARTTRRVAGHGLRRLISGFLWVVVVLTVLLIGGMISNGLTNTVLKVPFCVAFGSTMIWLVRRISRKHFRPDPRPSNETTSKSSADSSPVAETKPVQNSPSKVNLEPQRTAGSSEVPWSRSEKDEVRFEPEGEGTVVTLLGIMGFVFTLLFSLILPVLFLPFCVAALIWLVRRISRKHFRPDPRPSNETTSTSSADSSPVAETKPVQNSPSKVNLEPQRTAGSSEVPWSRSEKPVVRFEPEGQGVFAPLLVIVCFVFTLIGACLWVAAPTPNMVGTSSSSTAAVTQLEPPKPGEYRAFTEAARSSDNSSRTESHSYSPNIDETNEPLDDTTRWLPPQKTTSRGAISRKDDKVLLAEFNDTLESDSKEVLNVYGEQLTFGVPDGFGRLDSDAPDFVREYRKTVPPLVELLSLYLDDSDNARIRRGMRPLVRREISIRTLARPPISHYTQKHFDLVVNGIQTAGPKAVLDAGQRLPRELGVEDPTGRAARGIQEEVTQLKNIRYQNDCLITISMVKVAQTQDKAASVTWHAGAFAFCLRKGKIMEIRVMSRSSQRSKADFEWVTTMAKRCVHQLN